MKNIRTDYLPHNFPFLNTKNKHRGQRSNNSRTQILSNVMWVPKLEPKLMKTINSFVLCPNSSCHKHTHNLSSLHAHNRIQMKNPTLSTWSLTNLFIWKTQLFFFKKKLCLISIHRTNTTHTNTHIVECNNSFRVEIATKHNHAHRIKTTPLSKFYSLCKLNRFFWFYLFILLLYIKILFFVVSLISILYNFNYFDTNGLLTVCL